MSELFLRTLRDDPADAEVASHKLLIRAGYIRPIAPGLYSWLPLGLRVLRNIERVVREEMNAIGGQEILFPALLPRAPYETTNRWTEYGDGIFRLQDRRGNDYMLGPTHEELFTLTVKGEYSSYKDFPLVLFQIQNKYRDEARPRAGILRVPRVRDEGLLLLRHRRRRAQEPPTTHTARPTSAFSTGCRCVTSSCRRYPARWAARPPRSSWPRARVGEDTFVRCLQSGYAANVEAVVTARPEPLPVDGLPEAVVHDTGDTPTIATLVEWANGADLGRTVTAADTLKNVLLKVRQPGGDWELLANRGSRRPRGRRQAAGRRARTGRIRVARRRRLRQVSVPGEGVYRPEGVARQRCSLPRRPAGGRRHQLDHRRRPARASMSSGLVAGRDFTADGTIEAAEVRDGDPSPDGAGPLVSARGIEIGHIFQLGRKYTDAFTVDVLGEDGKPVRLTMGSYGLGVSRLVAVIAEQHHDELGLRWPSRLRRSTCTW